MVRKSMLLLLVAACMAAGCKSEPSKTNAPAPKPEAGNPFWDAGSASDGVIFLGVGGTISKKEEALRVALEDAARRVAIFNRVKGTVVGTINMGGGFFEYTNETKTTLEVDENYKSLVDSLIFDPETDVLKNNKGTFVRVRYPSSVQIPYWKSSFEKTAKPGWIDNPPRIPGYEVGVGYARLSAVRDGMTASYEGAIFSIINALYGSAKAEDKNVTTPGFTGTKNTTSQEIRAEGVLNNFYVLDAWIDPANGAVWTLGIAKSP